MINTRPLFYLALLLAAAGVVARHGASIDDILGLESLFTELPGAGFFLGAAGIFLVLSLIPFSKKKKGSLTDLRRLFVPEDRLAIASRVKLMAGEEEPDVPLIVDYTVFQAISADASDIHFDPGRSGLTLRYRLQGMMTDICVIPPQLTGSITNRLKVISNLVIYREALPQDGRFGTGGKGETKKELKRSGLADSDFRIAFMPTLHGERIVIRILGKGDDFVDFTELGMDDHEQRTLTRLLAKPQGMMVLTGPTGSGKSTTIYSCLRYIKGSADSVRSISTLEDPIEMDIEGINQSQVDEEKDFTFDRGLRAILRQDPDVIMVGEVRDPETARIAIQAGMTGHLIITTVHAGSAAAAFSRLLEMGAAPYSLNSAVTAVIAQRLVRRVCPGCLRERGLTEHDLKDLDMATPPEDFKLFHGVGCERCSGTGYYGRVAIYEILEVTESIRELISEGASVDAIKNEAKKHGTRSLRESAIHAVRVGLTSPEEVARVITEE